MRNFKSDVSGKHVRSDYAKQEWLGTRSKKKDAVLYVVAFIAFAFFMIVVTSVDIAGVITHGWN